MHLPKHMDITHEWVDVLKPYGARTTGGVFSMLIDSNRYAMADGIIVANIVDGKKLQQTIICENNPESRAQLEAVGVKYNGDMSWPYADEDTRHVIGSDPTDRFLNPEVAAFIRNAQLKYKSDLSAGFQSTDVTADFAAIQLRA